MNRFREELRGGADRQRAVATTVATAGLATVVSGGTVAIGFGTLTLSHLNVLWSMGMGGAIVVTVSVLASLTLIPALLSVFGSRVDSLALPFTRGRDTTRFWHGLASRVMARPLVFIGAALAITLVLAWPARSLRPGVLGPESLPPDDPAVKAERLGVGQLGFPARLPVLLVASGVGSSEQLADLDGGCGRRPRASPSAGRRRSRLGSLRSTGETATPSSRSSSRAPTTTTGRTAGWTASGRRPGLPG